MYGTSPAGCSPNLVEKKLHSLNHTITASIATKVGWHTSIDHVLQQNLENVQGTDIQRRELVKTARPRIHLVRGSSNT